MDSNICLTCLCKPSKAHNLNEIVLDNLQIQEMLHQMLPSILGHKEFTLPDTICSLCLEKLVISYTFRKQCSDSIKNLQKLWVENSSNKEKPQNADAEEDKFQSNEFKSNEESTRESLPEYKADLKMSFDEIAIDPLIANKDVEILLRQEYNESGKTQKEDTYDALNDKLQINESSNKTLQEKSLTGAVEEPSIVSNQCNLCKKIFKQPQGLASHMSKTHFKKHLYQCKKCGKGFSLEELFIRHCNRHLGVKPFPCAKCDKAFDTNSSLNQHMLCHSKEHSYLCTVCGKKFHRIDVYKQHKRRHDDQELFRCLKCAKRFQSFSEHMKHIETHKTEKFFDSKIYDENLSTSNLQVEHVEFDSTGKSTLQQKIPTEKNYQCQLCVESFSQNKDLRKHIRRIHKETNSEVDEQITMDSESDESLEMPFEQTMTEFIPDNKQDLAISVSFDKIEDNVKLNVKLEENEIGNDIECNNQSPTTTESAQCDLCNQIFKNSQGLARHRSSTHFKKHLYQCDQCDRGFSVEEFYIKHRNRHLGIKTFKCKQCDKAFETNSILNQHLISHSTLTPHLCTICGKSFRRLDGLRQHMLRHGEERPFKCSVCSKSFKCLSDKLKHMSIHDEKRYECNVCGSRLATPESLSQHQMTHTGEKPFKCSHCDKCFISLSNMKCHERIHTGEKPYKCQYCCKSFRQSNDRKKHTNRMHKNEMNNLKSEQNDNNLEGSS